MKRERGETGEGEGEREGGKIEMKRERGERGEGEGERKKKKERGSKRERRGGGLHEL